VQEKQPAARCSSRRQGLKITNGIAIHRTVEARILLGELIQGRCHLVEAINVISLGGWVGIWQFDCDPESRTVNLFHRNTPIVEQVVLIYLCKSRGRIFGEAQANQSIVTAIDYYADYSMEWRCSRNLPLFDHSTLRQHRE
jgi:hypothetical protein